MTLKNISLRWKFFFGFLITSLVPIVGFGVYAYTNTEKILLEQSYGNMEENLARASNNMDMVLDGYESASSLIFMNKQVQDLISVDFTNYGYEDLYYYLKNYFGTMMAINSDVNTFSIYTTNQTIAQDYYFIYKVTEEIEQEEWYRRARAENGKPVFMRGGVNKDGNYVFYRNKPPGLENTFPCFRSHAGNEYPYLREERHNVWTAGNRNVTGLFCYYFHTHYTQDQGSDKIRGKDEGRRIR